VETIDAFSIPKNYLLLFVYLTPIVLVWLARVRIRRKASKRHQQALKETVESGMTEPPSLHPLINRDLCIACNACAKACPEGDVLAIIGDKVELINPTHCIGHGACQVACPVDAITLVFGTEKRGVDIPLVDKTFETNVPGIYIAGELGGMGLIRNAIEQGRQAMESIIKRPGIGKGGNLLDVVIIGAGPAGFSASLRALQNKLNFVTVEQDTLGGTVAHFPRGKIVMTAPVDLAMIGKVKFRETSKEQLMDFWSGVAQKTNIKINYGERMEAITPCKGGFTVKTTRKSYNTKAVLLAIGRRGTPRKLNVPGENLSKVVYRLIDPEQYRGQHVLVVGGGDSALEAATSIAEEPGTHVTLSYRSGAISRAKPKNRAKVEKAAADGTLNLMLKSNVQQIEDKKVIIEQEGNITSLPNDAVIISAGGVLPTPLLKEIGITVETKHGTV